MQFARASPVVNSNLKRGLQMDNSDHSDVWCSGVPLLTGWTSGIAR